MLESTVLNNMKLLHTTDGMLGQDSIEQQQHEIRSKSCTQTQHRIYNPKKDYLKKLYILAFKITTPQNISLVHIFRTKGALCTTKNYIYSTKAFEIFLFLYIFLILSSFLIIVSLCTPILLSHYYRFHFKAVSDK